MVTRFTRFLRLIIRGGIVEDVTEENLATGETMRELEHGDKVQDGEYSVEVMRKDRRIKSDHGNLTIERDILKLLKRPIWIMEKWSTKTTPAQMWTFYSPASVEVFILGRDTRNYCLFIGKKIYDWPSHSGDVSEISAHIWHCIDIEASFFENPVCIEWMQEQQKKRSYWTKAKVE